VFLSGLIAAIVRARGRDKVRGEAGHEYNNNDNVTTDVNADKYEVPLGPAPAYSTTHHDVSNDAPYALNPHPLPRSSADVYDPQKPAPINNYSGYSSNNQNQPPYHNEKSGGFI